MLPSIIAKQLQKGMWRLSEQEKCLCDELG